MVEKIYQNVNMMHAVTVIYQLAHRSTKLKILLCCCFLNKKERRIIPTLQFYQCRINLIKLYKNIL